MMNTSPDSSADAATTSETSPPASSPSMMKSSIVRLSRSQQTWTGAGSAAGFVLRYLPAMRRLLTEILGTDTDAQRALTILVAHLVKVGYAGHDKGRLRDFLMLGIRSSAKARFAEMQASEPESSEVGLKELDLSRAVVDSPDWLAYWREALLQRAWRALERMQHGERVKSSPSEAEIPTNDLVHDILRITMSHPGESSEVIAGRVAKQTGRSVPPAELKRQLGIARTMFAQLIADEVSQTLEKPDAKSIRTEIKTLGLQKAFAGLQLQA